MKEIYNRDSIHRDSSPNTRKSWRFSLALLFGMFLSIASFGQTAYSESFDGATFVPSGWTNLLTSGTNTWTRVTTGTSPTTSPHSGAGFAKFNCYSANGGIRSLVSPVIDLTNRAGGATNVSFWMYRDDGYNTTADKIEVYYNTASNLTGATLLGTVNRARGLAPTEVANGWYKYTYAVPAGFTGSTNYLIIKGTSVYGNNIYVDDVAWEGFPPAIAPVCAISHAPLDAATGVVRNATLTWANGGGNPTSYDVYFGTSTNPALVGNQAGTSYTPAVLAASTQYFWKVVPKNAYGSATGCVERSFTTGTGFSYCAVSTTNSGDYTSAFSTTLANSNLAYTATSNPVGSYTDQTIQSFQVGQGLAFNFSHSYVGGSNGIKIWIDYGKDGTFDVSDEVFYIANSNATKTGSVTIPLATALGTYRMRVRSDYGTTVVPPACGNAPYGTTMDYTLTVITPPSCLPPTAFASSAITLSGASLSWTAASPAPTNGYDIYYSKTNTAPLAGTTPNVDNHPASPVSVSGLDSSSTYYWWVRSDCGAETSSWASGGSFTTLCGASSIPYTVPLTAVVVPALPSCTTVQNVNADTRTWVTSGSATGITGKVISYTYDSNNAANDWFYTNALNLVTGTTYRLKFKYANTSFDEKLKVAIGSSSVNSAMTTTLFSVSTGTTTATVSKVIDFTVGSSGSFNIGFQCFSDADNNVLYVGEISVEIAPSCLEPTALLSSAITATTATLSWTAPSTAPSNGYNYEIRTSGAAGSGATGLFVAGSTAAGIVTANITGLTASTSYSVYVQSNCGGSGTSTWTPAGTFTTTQIAATLPYTQDFSGSNGFSFVNGTQVNKWVNGSAAGNTGNSIYVSNDAGVTNAYDNASTSVVQAYRDIAITAGATVAQFSFDWKAKAESCCDYLRVWLVPTSFVPTAGTQIAAGTGRIQIGANLNNVDTWQTYTNGVLDVSSFAGQTMRLVFEWRNDGSGGPQTPAAVDNISLIIPTCVPPTALASSAITSTTATFSWTASTSTPTNGYDIYYSTTNTAPTAGTTPTVENHTASPLNETGLTPASTYYWWVRSDCGGETSTWASGGSFVTLCDAVTSFPWTENFESVTTPNLPNCWSANDANADSDKWISYPTYGVSSSNAAGLGTDFNAGNNNDYLILPKMTLTGNQRLKFFVRARSTGEPNDYRVALSTTGNQPADFTNELMPLTVVSSTTMTEIAPIDLSSYSGDVFIAVHVPSGGLDGYFLYVDNFTIEDIPSCLAPTALTASNLGFNSASLSWTSTGLNFDIKYGATGFNVATEGTLAEDFVSGSTLSGLTSSTNYQFYVRQDCGNGDLSAWAGPYSFSTLSKASVTWTESFATNVLPVGWISGGITPGTTTPLNSDATTNYLSINLWSSLTTANIQTIYVGELGTNDRLKFNYKLANYSVPYAAPASGSGNFKVEIQQYLSATWTEIATVSNNGIAGWQEVSYNLAAYAGEIVKMRITGNWISGDYWFGMDNFTIEPTPCPEWTGAVSTSWSVAGNWCDNMVPTAVSAVIINSANPVVISTDVTIATLTLGASAVVTVNGTLNVGNISVAAGGNLTIANDAALLQTNLATHTGIATVKRNSTSLFRQDYTLWSSPVFEPNLRNFSPNTIFSRFYSYGYATVPPVGDGGVYVQEITDAATVISKKFGTAKGYLIRMPNVTDPEIPGYSAGASGTTEMVYNGVFAGKLNNGTLSTPLYGVSAGVSNGLTLVGNPYPSPIKISELLAANTQISGTMYFWRKKNSIVNSAGSGYATYSSGTGSVAGANIGGGQTLTHIKTGQGFFVQSIGASPADLVFNNTMREKEATAGIFFKSGADAPASEMHRYWLNLSDATNVVGQTLVAYATGATQGVDSNFDALYFNDSPLALTSIINNAEYIIQGRAVPFMNTDVVPLGFKTDVAGSFTIALANFDGVFADNQDIFLLDKSSNTVHNLKTAAYTFTTPVGVFNERFEVKYEGSLGTNNPSLASNNILIAVKDQQIKINAGSVVMEKIELIDVAGRVIYTLEGVNATTATLENVVSSNQMLVVRISTKENGVVTQKIIF